MNFMQARAMESHRVRMSGIDPSEDAAAMLATFGNDLARSFLKYAVDPVARTAALQSTVFASGDARRGTCVFRSKTDEYVARFETLGSGATHFEFLRLAPNARDRSVSVVKGTVLSESGVVVGSTDDDLTGRLETFLDLASAVRSACDPARMPDRVDEADRIVFADGGMPGHAARLILGDLTDRRAVQRILPLLDDIRFVSFRLMRGEIAPAAGPDGLRRIEIGGRKGFGFGEGGLSVACGGGPTRGDVAISHADLGPLMFEAGAMSLASPGFRHFLDFDFEAFDRLAEGMRLTAASGPAP